MGDHKADMGYEFCCLLQCGVERPLPKVWYIFWVMFLQNSRIAQLGDFLTADYSQQFPGDDPVSRVFNFFANPWVPIVSVVLYLALSDVVFEAIRKTFDIKPKGTGLQVLTIVHSLALAVYSLWTFVNAFTIARGAIVEKGFYAALCDSDLEIWDGRNYGFWVTHFYISKFYEFIDTW
jgi:hypothetical protein